MNVLTEWTKLTGVQGGTIHQVMNDAQTIDIDILDNFCSYLATNEVLYNLDDPHHASQLQSIRLNRLGLNSTRL